MSEFLVRVKPRENSGVLLHDCKQFDQGDVLVIKADGWPWGECELGGRFANPAKDAGFSSSDRVFTQSIMNNFSRKIMVLLDSSVDMSAIFSVDMIPRGKIKLINRSDWQLMGEDLGFEGYRDFAVDKANYIVSATEFSNRTVRYETRHISEHVRGNHSFYRVLQFPKISEAQAAPLLLSQTNLDESSPSQYLLPRASYINRALVPNGALANHMDDDLRAHPVLKVNTTWAVLSNYISVRDRIAPP